jgi:hypothetical protein
MARAEASMNSDCRLRVCSYEDRQEAMDGVILMGESLCRADPEVSLHLTVPSAPASLLSWAKRWPQIALSTSAPERVSGWDVKPFLLLEELNAGNNAAIWLDSDTIVTRPISVLLGEFPRDSLLVSEEWNRHDPIPVTQHWGFTAARQVWPTNSSFVRATAAHRPLLERWLQMTSDPRYRQAQSIPFEERPFHLCSDQVLLNAVLESEEFGLVSVDYLRLGRDIAQCAGSSGYRPFDRLLDLFRGLPPLIHCIGRKPWQSRRDWGRVSGFLTDLATDVSPYVLASRKVARELHMSPRWLDARTSLGAILRGITAYHPGMAGLPLAIMHAVHLKISQTIGAGT